ncbi:leucine--tRNA ligase [Candidatus Saccharibacteria bacterium]|nr:leucine--tRNA ligase [Candidatus Saccharibacteria bacterium]
MDRYNPAEIEKKWQKIWEETEAFKAPALNKIDKNQAKMYLAEMFPYPSGAGLHVGHVRNFTIVDVLTRFYTQQEMNVLRPFGYDTFGLPAENYAIKTGTAPQEVTKENIANFRRQAKKLGFAIDWSREINTSNPEYYKWTQWCFLQLYKKGLAYRKESYQWWCPVDQTVLANEQVENGHCWRCGAEVEKKKMKQWFFKITAYADELLDEIDALDWPDKIKTMQKNWIGRSEGAEIDFDVVSNNGNGQTFVSETVSQISYEKSVRPLGRASEATASDTRDGGLARAGLSGKTSAISDNKLQIKVFTTRPDTIFGATFLVLAPEHPLVHSLIIPQTAEKVNQYQTESLKKSEIERQENKEKTGVFTGSYAINPATGEKIPIWISDYVLMGYGEGAIMAVPAHDERDFEFAEKFDLPIKQVIEKPENSDDDSRCYHGEGELVNSGQFDGTRTEDAREQIVAWLEQQGVGKSKVTYRMRDWLISRQRYWGCPIPIAYDKNGEPHAIPEDKLPVILPEVTDYQPDKTGRSALAKATDWLKVEIDGEEMTRETDTLDGYACSSWYLWRYVSPHDDKAAWDKDAIKYWAPTDIYVGADHAVAHLLYIRFWCKFFADEGFLPFREPVKKLLYNGYINAPDGKKMSKSKGNVIDPLDVIDSGYGADTLRTYEMFIGPYNEDASWDTKAIGGVYRFLNRCWNLAFDKEISKEDLNITTRNKTIKKVTEDLHRVSFNTAVAALMEYVNELYKNGTTAEDNITLAKLLKPFAPHLASEILEKYDSNDIWPVWDESALVEDTVEVVVQVNGKLRAKITVFPDDLLDEEKLTELALKEDNVARRIDGTPKKVIIPKNAKLINIVA